MEPGQAIVPELLYQQSIEEGLAKVKALKDIDLVIGVPYYSEREALPDLLRTVAGDLAGAHAGERVLLLTVGDPAAGEWLAEVAGLELSLPHVALMMQPGSNGRGASIRAILDVADCLQADAVVLAADIREPGGGNLHAGWIGGVIEPLRQGYDLVLTSFTRPYWYDVVGCLFTAPLLEVFYGCAVLDPSSGIYGLSRDLIADYRSEIRFWFDSVRGYGIDAWLLTRAIRRGSKLCEVELGFSGAGAARRTSWAKLNYVFKETAKCLFECIRQDEDYWSGGRGFLTRPDRYDIRGAAAAVPETFGRQEPYSLAELIDQFKLGYHDYQSLFELAMTSGEQAAVKQAVSLPPEEFRFEGGLWADIVYCWLFHYWFNSKVQREDMLNALAPAFGGRVAGVLGRIRSFRAIAGDIPGADLAGLIAGEAHIVREEQTAAFRRLWYDFLAQWSQKARLTEPRLVPAYSLEFVPGKPIVLPEVIPVHQNSGISARELFNRLQQRYQQAFNHFLRAGLQVSENASSPEVTRGLQELMAGLEAALDRLFPGDLHTEEGVKRVAGQLFEVFAPGRVFTVKTDVLKEMLFSFPPVDLLIAGGFAGSQELIDSMGVRNAASLANLGLGPGLGPGLRPAGQVLSWMLNGLRPEELEEVDLQPLILGADILGGSVTLGHISRLDKLAARVLVSPLAKGMGGEYPRLRYCLYIARQMGVAENYSALWRHYAREKRDLGLKMANSLAGHYGAQPFAACNILENIHQRSLVGRLAGLGNSLDQGSRPEAFRLIRLLHEGYGLGQVLADGVFMPCSAWTWASYSYKGGKGLPTPLSSRVEEQWFAHELLEEIYRECGYDPEEIWKRVAQLIGGSRAGESLIDALLGRSAGDVTAVTQEAQDYPPAQMLVRHPGNPILTAVKQRPWESKYVLNPGVVRIGDRVYLLYRAVGDDGVSRLGLAVTDGFNLLERLSEPVFSPQDEKEKQGIEDPRLVRMGEQIYMLYTAYDGVTAQIAAASISVDDFLNRRFERWSRRGRAFEDIWDKDAVLFPERINGHYILYHRIEPSIWLTYMDNLEFPGPREKHAIIMGPRLGKAWDSAKIGAGTQPIKTRYGWLLIYHGVDDKLVYRLGVMLVDLHNPGRVLYRSPNPVLAPETELERGQEGSSWVRNTVFTCGAAPAGDKEVLDAGDDILVYYGAADTCICVATATVGDLIPEAVRRLPQ